jgi:hypothetical protein
MLMINYLLIIRVRLVLALLLLIGFALPQSGFGQAGDTTGKAAAGLRDLSTRDIRKLERKYATLEAGIQRSDALALEDMQRSEARLQNKISGPDSSAAKRIFTGASTQYQRLSAQIATAPQALTGSARTYLSRLDSLQTTLHFLTGPAASGIPAAKIQQLQSLSQELQQVQAKWAQASAVQSFIQQREQFLQQKLSGYNANALLSSVNRKAWYYQQQLAQYKNELNDPEKIGQMLLNAVRQLPTFQSFWQKNSLLAQLFPLPANYGTPMALNGLQSRADIQQLLQGRGTVSANSDYASQQVEQGQSTLDKLKEKVGSVGGTSGSGDMTLPNFTPDGQHGKSLWHRLEYGFNIQNGSQTSWLPVTTDLAVTLGYKFSDKVVAGVGAGFLLGLGSGIQSIHLSSQGISLRAYTDIRLKGGWWLSGGLEDNYYQALAPLADLPSINEWQQSLLTGLMRKWSIGKRSANMQLLFDWLYARQTPQGQPLKFRIGYTF